MAPFFARYVRYTNSAVTSIELMKLVSQQLPPVVKFGLLQAAAHIARSHKAGHAWGNDENCRKNLVV